MIYLQLIQKRNATIYLCRYIFENFFEPPSSEETLEVSAIIILIFVWYFFENMLKAVLIFFRISALVRLEFD